MRKQLLILFALLAFQANAQTLTEIQKLESAARIWGFLKYYHPQVAAGKFDWDAKLIELIPMVEKTATKEELSALYLEWIDGLGEVPMCIKCAEEEGNLFNKNFSMAWMEDEAVFTEALTSKLKHIENNRLLGDKYYAGPGRVGEVAITNEPKYKDFDYPAKAYRLLSLYHYWNIIEYFFPYKYQTDQKWDDVLTEMIPKFRDAKDAPEYHLAMLETVTKIDDSHGSFVSGYTNEYFGYYWAPFKFKIIDGKAVVTDFYDRALAANDDILIGDAVTHVNGVPVNDILAEKSRYIPASNAAGKKNNAFFAIFNGSTDKALITFERDGRKAEKEISRYLRSDFKPEEKLPKEKYKLLEGNIGYVDMDNLEQTDLEGMMKDLGDCKAIIFDIRSYPNFILYHLANEIMSGTNDFVTLAKPCLDYPGKYKLSSLPVGGENNNAYKGKVIVLADENTKSRAEFTIMALQARGNVTVVGSQTAGADGDVSVFTFPGNYRTMITGVGVFYPDGRETQRIGIVPDVEVFPTIAGIRAGRDEVLEKAIEVALR